MADAVRWSGVLVMGHDAYQAAVNVTPDQITPLYDWLLVRRLHEEEHTGLIIPPGYVQGRGGQWVKKADSGPRRGQVLAAGRGEKVQWRCTWCSAASPEPTPDGWITCPTCGTQGATDRAGMAVSVGDVILYPRFESSHVNINGETLTFVREGDVMAVLDEG